MTTSNDLRTNLGTIAVLTNALRRNGLRVPEAPSVLQPMRLATRTDVTDAAIEALYAGKDPLRDKNVQQVLTSYHLAEAGLHAQIEAAQTRDRLEHLTGELPELVEQLKEQFTNDVALLKNTIPKLGHVDLTKGVNYTPGFGTEKLLAMAEAIEALNRATIVTETWATFMDAINQGAKVAGQYKRLWYCTPTWQQFTSNNLPEHQRLNRHGRTHNVWDMLNDNINVSLAMNHEEFEERLEQLAAGEQAAELEARQAQQDRRPNYSNSISVI